MALLRNALVVWQTDLMTRFLDRMGQVVQTDNFLNGSRALRAVLIAAAADGDSITVLELLQEYPLDVIQLDFPLMQQIIREYQRFFANRETTVAQLRTIDDTRNRPLLTTGLQPTQTGPYSWQQETLNFQNPLRDGDIPFDVYLPQTAPLSDVNAAASVPIIVFSHGVASGRQALRYLAQHLASHGYAVVVPQHYDDNRKYFQFLAGIENP
ncbi:MAG: alpha/beta hydrolase, partial [Cyanobacteria bacterium P01_F01_bin.53]